MLLADLQWPNRLLAGGGPSTPDPRVLRALGAPGIGQFDPDFTAIMDDVSALARAAFVTHNARCFAVSGLAAAGLEAFLTTLVQDGDRLAVGGGPRFFAETTECARRYGAEVSPLDQLGSGTKLAVVPLIDPHTGCRADVRELARVCHAAGTKLLVEATLGLGATDLRVDEWGIDACIAGADYAIGAPSGMSLVTYNADVEALMGARRTPPRTSYLDLLQLQDYWSAERLNHHTAPTSLVYGLREALRLVHAEGLEERWSRHTRIGQLLLDGLEHLELHVSQAQLPYVFVEPAATRMDVDEVRLRSGLLADFGISVRLVGPTTWRIGLLGADARPEAINRLLAALQATLDRAT